MHCLSYLVASSESSYITVSFIRMFWLPSDNAPVTSCFGARVAHDAPRAQAHVLSSIPDDYYPSFLIRHLLIRSSQGTDFKVDGGLSSAYVTALGEPVLPPPTSLVG